jgi:chemotaxis response regulator CheB
MLFSPNDKAIEVNQLSNGGVIELLNSERMTKDYIDTMFESASKAFKGNTIAVLLAGAAVDGIEGLRAVKQRGGKTFVEAAPDIPAKIINEQLAGSILSLSEIASEVSKLII